MTTFNTCYYCMGMLNILQQMMNNNNNNNQKKIAIVIDLLNLSSLTLRTFVDGNMFCNAMILSICIIIFFFSFFFAQSYSVHHLWATSIYFVYFGSFFCRFAFCKISLYSHLSIPSKSAYDKNDDDYDDAGETKSICIPFIFCGWVCSLFVYAVQSYVWACVCLFVCSCALGSVSRLSHFHNDDILCRETSERTEFIKTNKYLCIAQQMFGASILFWFGESERAIVAV